MTTLKSKYMIILVFIARILTLLAEQNIKEISEI